MERPFAQASSEAIAPTDYAQALFTDGLLALGSLMTGGRWRWP
jgi:hypothetical protein